MESTAEHLALSVILCTHNPRPQYIERVLNALRVQSLSVERWELIIVDNASSSAVVGMVDLSWHPRARVVREESLGLSQARRRGISESRAPVLVFVDDDNVLCPDYLSVAHRIGHDRPTLGVWSGRVELEFATAPPEWTRRYWTFLAERLVDQDEVTSGGQLIEPMPVGAGMCVRREGACLHAKCVLEDPLRQQLGRSGVTLSSGEDTDLALTVCEGGWERGVFKSLQLRHLIPDERLTEDYLTRLSGGIYFSTMFLRLIHKPHVPPAPTNLWWWIRYGCDCAVKFGRGRRFYKSYKRAHRLARALYDGGLAKHMAEDRIKTHCGVE